MSTQKDFVELDSSSNLELESNRQKTTLKWSQYVWWLMKTVHFGEDETGYAKRSNLAWGRVIKGKVDEIDKLKKLAKNEKI